uniref:Uncharacterized protein n=1 Tax=Lactuca sativa TaxID=4236 RepID=A0A9R1WCW3_LACSA|nr:hypothetical protein LSAT_V11C200068730 [Lactuca sativa]
MVLMYGMYTSLNVDYVFLRWLDLEIMFRDVPPISKILEGYRALTPSGPHPLSDEFQAILPEADKAKKGGIGSKKATQKNTSPTPTPSQSEGENSDSETDSNIRIEEDPPIRNEEDKPARTEEQEFVRIKEVEHIHNKPPVHTKASSLNHESTYLIRGLTLQIFKAMLHHLSLPFALMTLKCFLEMMKMMIWTDSLTVLCK